MMDQSFPISVSSSSSSSSSSYPFNCSFVHDPLSLNRAGESTSSSSVGGDQGIRKRAQNLVNNGFIRYPSLCSDVDDDPRPYPQLFAGASEETPEAPSIPCALFWTFHFCLSVNALKEFRRENDALRQDLVGEIKRHRNTLASLDAMRSEMDEQVWELEMAKEKADREARRCEEAHQRLEQMMGRMKRESMLRMKWEREATEESRRRREAEEGWRREGEKVVERMLQEEMEEMEEREEREKVVSEERRLRREAEARAAEERRWRVEEEARAAEERWRRSEAEGKAAEERRLREEAEKRAFEARMETMEAEAALKKAVVEYSFHELRSATDSFHEANRILQEEEAEDDDDEYGGVLYKGTCQGVSVSVRVLLPLLNHSHHRHVQEEESEEEARTRSFRREVAFWSRIHHPHIVTLFGACTDIPCLVYDHMANGNLERHLSGHGGTPPLPWHVRFRICSELAAAVRFLHSLPETVAHGNLNLKNVFLDNNLVCKVGDVGMNKLLQALSPTTDDPEEDDSEDDVNLSRINQESDVQALGVIMLQLLTGLPSDVVVEEVDRAIDSNGLEGTLDVSAGEWPLVETMELACLSLQLAERRNSTMDMMAMMMEAMEKIRACAEEGAAREKLIIIPSPSEEEEPPRREQQQALPNYFMCPISQEIMENPCIAADGFCYDEDHIQAWLANHDTSPMTNLRLDHLNLIPNIPLRAAIREWHESSR